MPVETDPPRQPVGDRRRRLSLDDVIADYGTPYRTVGETVLEILRTAIVEGALEPGERLRQERLARRLGVSRIPVRTALYQLEAEGLVDFEPRHGAIVRVLTPARVRETYDLRILLETHAIRAADQSLTAHDRARAVELATQLDRTGEGPEFLAARIAFYRTLYDADTQPLTVGLIEQLRAANGKHWLGARVKPHDFAHDALARHVQHGEITAAETLLREHLTHVRDEIIAHL